MNAIMTSAYSCVTFIRSVKPEPNCSFRCEWPLFMHSLDPEVISGQFGVIDRQVERSIGTDGVKDLKSERVQIQRKDYILEKT